MRLRKKYKVEKGKLLAGGVISSINEAALQLDKKKPMSVVIKKTTHSVVAGKHFSHSDSHLISAAPKTHHLDTKVLKLLQEEPEIRVPRVHLYYKRSNTTIMEDFRAGGFTLMQDLLIQNKLPIESAHLIGTKIAKLQLRLAAQKIKIVENAPQQIRERLQEIHVLLYDDLDEYRRLEAKLLETDGPIWTDAHPKNMAINGTNEVMFFDFGRIINGSYQYTIANFTAHIGLASIGGVIDVNFAKKYIKDSVLAYSKIIRVNERWFVKFFVAELVHRGLAMRWIDKRLVNYPPMEVKMAVYNVFLKVFNDQKQFSSVESLLKLLEITASQLKAGKFKNL